MLHDVVVVWPRRFVQQYCVRSYALVRFSISNKPQNVAKGWPNARNMLCPTMLRYVAFKSCDRLAGTCKCWANNVRICCVEMLRSFGRSLINNYPFAGISFGPGHCKNSKDPSTIKCPSTHWLWQCSWILFSLVPSKRRESRSQAPCSGTRYGDGSFSYRDSLAQFFSMGVSFLFSSSIFKERKYRTHILINFIYHSFIS